MTENGNRDALALLERHQQVFPQLHTPGARTVARDRWERLISAIEIPARVEEVWHALVTPERVALWFGVCHGSLEASGQDVMLDFEDGEYFLIRPVHVEPRSTLRYLTRWLGIGQATVVTWTLEGAGNATLVTVTEEATNPPWDWQTWNGGGWPGILDQLAAHVRTGTRWRWPWRRMGPYAQVELPVSLYAAWDTLFCASGLKYWLLSMEGAIEAGKTLPIMMGDASGVMQMVVDEVAQPGQKPPSFLPHVAYRLQRPSWGADVPGRLWLEPAGWGKSLLQAFHYNWESLPAGLQLSERKILAGYWADAARRAAQFINLPMMIASQAQMKPDTAPHNW